MDTIFVEDGILEDANEIIAELFDHSDITDLECDSDGWDFDAVLLEETSPAEHGDSTSVETVLAPASVVESPRERVMASLVSTPLIICELCNSGDLDKLREYINEVFAEDCTLLTDPLKSAVTGRQHVFDFYLALNESFPDLVIEVVKSSFSRSNTIAYELRFSGTFMSDVETERTFFLKSKTFVNNFSDIIEKNVRRPLDVNEKRKLKAAENLVKSGKGFPHLQLQVKGKYVIAKGSSYSVRPPIAHAEILWKIRGFSVAAIPQNS